MANSFGSLAHLTVGEQSYEYYRLAEVVKRFPQAARLPYSLKILLENLLRTEDNVSVRAADVEALAQWDPASEPDKEIAFTPSRVLLQDFTGVPAVVDLAAMRDAMARLGGDPKKINPLQPAELVIDHSVQVDEFGSPLAFEHNAELEFARNRERYVFLRWGQAAFHNLKVVPPDTGIVHQVNLEFLARVVFVNRTVKPPLAYPDTLVGTDSHTTMVNGLGVLGWGVGGIEAEAAMLGQPLSMLIPQVVGFRLTGKLREGATATDLVLTVTQMLRKKGVVGQFVEFHGEGLAELQLADRATIANMSPEYGATCGIFPVDAETLRYLRATGRPETDVELVEAYFKEQGLFHTAASPPARYSSTLELDLATVEPSLAGPSRPQDRVRLHDMAQAFQKALPSLKAAKKPTSLPLTNLGTEAAVVPNPTPPNNGYGLTDGRVVIAAITSCTNTSNPSVMLAAGLLAQKAVALGLQSKPWVKTSLAPGSKVVTEYLREAGLLPALEQLRFNLVGYGCTTCIAEGTPVLMADGTACPIERMPDSGAVLFGPTGEGELALAVQIELMARGERDCIELVLQDGRTLVCTPDHEILCADGRWRRADQLAPGRDRVVVGLEAPRDEPAADEADYFLSAGEFTFTFDMPHHRRRALAFARLLGHLLGDGSISAAGQGRMTVGQAIDCEVVLNDIELLTGKRPTATRYDEQKWTIVLPAKLTEAIIALPGVRVGRRIDQAPRLPEFVLDDRCPVAVVREFLGGVFGADGEAPTLKRLSEREEDAILQPPAYAQSARPKHVGPLQEVMSQLLRLLARCGVETEGAKVYEYPVRRAASSYPPAQDGGPRVEVRLGLSDGLSFVERVGFRYCVDKSLRASAAAVYWRIVDRIHHQRLWMSARLYELHQQRPKLSFSTARAQAAAELQKREPVVFPHYSLLEGHDRFDRLPAPEARKFQPLYRESCGFPSPVELFRQLGVRDWFARLLAHDEADYSKRYCAEKEAVTWPTFALGVLEKRPAGARPVFDLAVNDVHAFVAGTVAVHNCIGNSGPLPEAISKEIESGSLVVAAVLSGNRNFEGRVHPEVRANYLASPPLVVAYALAGRVDFDWESEPLGTDGDGRPVFLRDVWPTQAEVTAARSHVHVEQFQQVYRAVYDGDARWQSLVCPQEDRYQWDDTSTYVKNPPFFEKMTLMPDPVTDLAGARALAVLGDSITTDHISPAGSIKKDSPAGRYLMDHGVQPKDFNSYGSRRGNHEVMMRGTFANVRLKNALVPGVEGGFTRHLPDGEQLSIFDAAMKYVADGVPLVVLAGKEYGSGSSRDWAAKGTLLLGVRAVVAESYERIHRSNLVGMGVLPLQFKPGDSVASLQLTGEEVFDLPGLATAVAGGLAPGHRTLAMRATAPDGRVTEFPVIARIDTPRELEYFKHGGILQFVLRELNKKGT